MKLRVELDTGWATVVERDDDRGFASWCMMLVREGFTTVDGVGEVYVPGHRIGTIRPVVEKFDA